MPIRDTAPPGRRLGRIMSIAAWVIALLLLTLIFGGFEERLINPNQNPQTSVSTDGLQQLVLEANRQGHYLVSGQINDASAVFLVDTGATEVVVSEHLAERAKLMKGASGTALTANGAIRVYATRIARLQIGNIILYDVAASISPQGNDFVLLGMSALNRLELIHKDQQLLLRAPPQPLR